MGDPELEAIERRLDSIAWTIDMLYGVMGALVAERKRLRAREAKARTRALTQAKEYLGDAVEVAG